MPENSESLAKESSDSRQSLEKAFAVFQEQSELLEKSHRDLKEQLEAAQLSLARKNAELAGRIDEAEAVKEKLSGILSSITDAVFLIDSNGNIDLANRAAWTFFQKALKEKNNLLELSGISDYLDKGDFVQDVDVQMTINEQKRHFMLSITPMSDTPRGLGCKVVSLKDVTEQRRLQERVRREDRLAALGKVAASVAHEIRNPLGAIEGFASLLERDLRDDPKARRLAEKTVYGAKQLNAVVSNLLNYARELRADSTVNELNVLIIDALQFVKPIADDHQIELVVDLSESPLSVKISAVQFRQVVTNLAMNAVDACPIRAGGKVEIRTRRKEGTAIVEVADNGDGVAKENKKRIFEPFFTLKEGGVGLGLSLCHRFIEVHDGEIAETGVPGEGARFIVKLPIAEK